MGRRDHGRLHHDFDLGIGFEGAPLTARWGEIFQPEAQATAFGAQRADGPEKLAAKAAPAPLEHIFIILRTDIDQNPIGQRGGLVRQVGATVGPRGEAGQLIPIHSESTP